MSENIELCLPEISTITVKDAEGIILFQEELVILNELLMNCCGDSEEISTITIDAFRIRLIERYGLDEDILSLTHADLLAGKILDLYAGFKKKLDTT